MSCTPPWRCMGANDITASHLSPPPLPPLVRPISPSAFAAALRVLAAARDETDSEQVVQNWMDRMHPELAVSTASTTNKTGTETATITSGAWETASGGTLPNKSNLSRPSQLQRANALRRTRRQHGRAESQQPSNIDEKGYEGDDEEARVQLASPRLTTHHLLTGCHRSLPAEIIPLDLDLPLPPQDCDDDNDDESALDAPGCCPRHSRGARVDRLHIALLDYLRLPAHRWPGRWRGRRFKERTWMSSFDGAAETDTVDMDEPDKIMEGPGTDTF